MNRTAGDYPSGRPRGLPGAVADDRSVQPGWVGATGARVSNPEASGQAAWSNRWRNSSGSVVPTPSTTAFRLAQRDVELLDFAATQDGSDRRRATHQPRELHLASAHAQRRGHLMESSQTPSGARMIEYFRELLVPVVVRTTQQRCVCPQLDVVLRSKVHVLVIEHAETMNVARRQRAGSRSQIGGTELERIDRAGTAVDGVLTGALNSPGGMIRGANAINRPHRDEIRDGVHGLLDRYRPVLLMKPEQVDRIHAESVEAAGECGPDRGRRESLSLLGPATDDSRLRAQLRGDFHPIADTLPGCRPSTEQRFTLPAVPGIAGPELEAICRIDPSAAGLDEPVQECKGSRFVDARAEHHRAEYQRGGCRRHEFTLRPGVGSGSSGRWCTAVRPEMRSRTGGGSSAAVRPEMRSRSVKGGGRQRHLECAQGQLESVPDQVEGCSARMGNSSRRPDARVSCSSADLARSATGTATSLSVRSRHWWGLGPESETGHSAVHGNPRSGRRRCRRCSEMDDR